MSDDKDADLNRSSGDEQATDKKPPEPQKMVEHTTTIIKHKGGFFRPIGYAIAIVIVGWFGAWGYIQYSESAIRQTLHNQAVHKDRSEVKIKVKRVFVDRPVEIEKKVLVEKIIYREPDPKILKPGEAPLIVAGIGGRTVKVAINQAGLQELSSFQKEMVLFIEGERRRTNAMVQSEIKRVFLDAFADKEDSLKKYSEWFFAWSRSWILLKEALVAAVTELPKGVSKERTEEAVRNTLTEYLMRHYEEFILKPELRNGPIERGLTAVFKRAHEQYLSMMKQLDLKRQLFIKQHTRHMEDLPSDAVQVNLDWESQKWKAPSYALENKALETFRTVGFVAGGALLGRTLGKPILKRIMRQLGLRVAAANSTAIEGAIAGTILEPVGGTIIGAVLGLGVDYVWSKVDEQLGEDEFIAENRKAVDETLAVWENTIQKTFLEGVDIWMYDTLVVVKSTMPQDIDIVRK